MPCHSYQLAGPVEHQVDDLLADGVVAAGVVVGCVLFARDELLGVEQLTVGPGAHLICKGKKRQASALRTQNFRSTVN